jgi:hypothetical protein
MGMTQHIENPQGNLLELFEDAPPVALPSAQKTQLATLLEMMLREIAMTLADAALAAQEVGDDEDHR